MTGSLWCGLLRWWTQEEEAVWGEGSGLSLDMLISDTSVSFVFVNVAIKIVSSRINMCLLFTAQHVFIHSTPSSPAGYASTGKEAGLKVAESV